MPTFSPVRLTDDHLDLLTSAVASWRVLAAGRSVPPHAAGDWGAEVTAAATATGRLLRRENAAALEALSGHAAIRVADRKEFLPYTFRPVTHIDPVEVIKAAHAAQACCSGGPTWVGSVGEQLLSCVITAATYRLNGYVAAPWIWTRPSRGVDGVPVGVTSGDHPDIPGLRWVDPGELRAHWYDASFVVVQADAVGEIPPDLPARPGVFLLSHEKHPDVVWESLSALDMQALALFWPSCQTWLAEQLADPERAGARAGKLT